MKRIILSLLFILSLTQLFGAIDPFYKEVLQRGYELIPGDSVRFPDGSACSINAFNSGECGQEWMTEDYCVPEGSSVWDNDKCCEGLEPYLEEGVDGQETCQKIQEAEDGIGSYFSSKTVLYFFMGVLIPLGLFVILAISVKKKMSKNLE